MTATAPPGSVPPRAVPRRWLRLPRRTVRLRLTLLYGGLFLASGAGLLLVTYLLVRSYGTVELVKSQTSHIGDQGRPLTKIGVREMHQQPGPQLLTQAGLALSIMAAVSIGLGWLMAGRVLRPLRTITTAAQRMSAHNLHERLALHGPDDELKELGDTFDGLLARLEAAFGAQRAFVANASHELRTPLARQRALLEVALADDEPTVAALQTTCRRALVAEQQQEHLIEALLTLARSQRGLDRREEVDLAAVVGEAVQTRQADARQHQVDLAGTLDEAQVRGDARLVARLAANLLDNALSHNTPHGWVRVTTGMHDGHPTLWVANTGPDIPPAEVGRLFQPFQRLQAERAAGGNGRAGSPGLGLSIVEAITHAHHASLAARALPGGGLEVTIQFPTSG